MSKHTPGPWVAEDIPSGGWKIKAVIARIPDKLRGIIEISAPRYTSFTVGEDGKLWATIAYEEYVQFPPDDIKEQWAANAKLAAKSPEMFELLKELVKLHLKTCGRCVDRGSDTVEPCEFLPDAVMLIKEIEG